LDNPFVTVLGQDFVKRYWLANAELGIDTLDSPGDLLQMTLFKTNVKVVVQKPAQMYSVGIFAPTANGTPGCPNVSWFQ